MKDGVVFASGRPGSLVLAGHAGLPGGEFQDGAAVGADVRALEYPRLDLALAADEVLPRDRLLAGLADGVVFGKGRGVHGPILAGRPGEGNPILAGKKKTPAVFTAGALRIRRIYFAECALGVLP